MPIYGRIRVWLIVEDVEHVWLNSTCPSNPQGHWRKWSANLFDYIYAWASARGHRSSPCHLWRPNTHRHTAGILLKLLCSFKRTFTGKPLYFFYWNLGSGVKTLFFLGDAPYNLYKPLFSSETPLKSSNECKIHVSTWILTSFFYLLTYFFQLIHDNPNDQETTTRFQVGSSFSGEQALGGAFTAMASWIEARSHRWMDVFYGIESSIIYGIHNLSHIYHWYPLWSYVVNYMGYSNTECLTLWFWRKIWCFYFFGGDWFLQWLWHTISVSIFLFVLGEHDELYSCWTTWKLCAAKTDWPCELQDKEPQQPASLHLVKQFATEGLWNCQCHLSLSAFECFVTLIHWWHLSSTCLLFWLSFAQSCRTWTSWRGTVVLRNAQSQIIDMKDFLKIARVLVLLSQRLAFSSIIVLGWRYPVGWVVLPSAR